MNNLPSALQVIKQRPRNKDAHTKSRKIMTLQVKIFA